MAKGALLRSNPSIRSKLSCGAGFAQDAQIARVAQLPRVTLETEQPEYPSTRAYFGLVLGLLGVLMS